MGQRGGVAEVHVTEEGLFVLCEDLLGYGRLAREKGSAHSLVAGDDVMLARSQLLHRATQTACIAEEGKERERWGNDDGV